VIDDMKTEESPFTGWCVLELFGHRRIGGYVREVEFAGAKMVRIDIPADADIEDSKPITQLYGGSAIYCLSPVGEEEAKAVAKRARPEPVSRYEVQAAKAIPAAIQGDPFTAGPYDEAREYDDEHDFR
jgi:hypothetical protein